MALDLCQNFVPAHYLENKLREFHQILYMHLYNCHSLGWDCYLSHAFKRALLFLLFPTFWIRS